jgi:hypothetical protein
MVSVVAVAVLLQQAVRNQKVAAAAMASSSFAISLCLVHLQACPHLRANWKLTWSG